MNEPGPETNRASFTSATHSHKYHVNRLHTQAFYGDTRRNLPVSQIQAICCANSTKWPRWRPKFKRIQFHQSNARIFRYSAKTCCYATLHHSKPAL